MPFEIGGDILGRPVDQRIDLEPPLRVGGVDLEARQIGTCRGLERLAPGEAGIEIDQHLFERFDLAQFAAPVGIVGPAQPAFVARLQIGDLGIEIDPVQTEAIGQFVTIGERFGEMLARFEKQHRHGRIGLRDQVQQHRAFGAEARHHGHIAHQTALDYRAQPFLGLGPAEHAVETDGIVLGKPGTGVDTIDGAHVVHGCRLLQIGVRVSAAFWYTSGQRSKAAITSSLSSCWSGSKASKPQRRI